MQRNAWVIGVILAGVLVPIAYLLSIGPAAALVANGTITIATFDTIFAPINMACIRWEAVQDIVGWYIGFWAF